MFASNGKKELRKRSRTLTSRTLPTQAKTIDSNIVVAPTFNLNKLEEPKTVFAGLKLTESLYDELSKVKSVFDSKVEELEKIKIDNELL